MSHKPRIGKKVYHAAMVLLSALPSIAADPLPLGRIPAGKSFLIILSHHDDHTWQWGFGGFAARLVDEGWTGYFVRTTNDEKDGGAGWGQNELTNLKESREGAGRLGLKEVISLHWRNDHMDSIPIRELRGHFILLIRRYRPDIVMTWNPWGHYDRNPDHRKVARAAGEAVWMAGLDKVHPEHLDAGLAAHRVPYVYYTQRSDYGRGHVPNLAIEFNAAQLARAQEAFWSHKNVYNTPAAARSIREALARRNLEIPELAGLTDEQAIEKLQKWHIEYSARQTGVRAGVNYAEAFFFQDEWDHLPGLAAYLKSGARPE